MANKVNGKYTYVVLYERDVEEDGKVVRKSLGWRYNSVRDAFEKYDLLKDAWEQGIAGHNVSVELIQEFEMKTTLAWFS